MFGLDPASPLASSFRRLRSRLGFSSPRVAIRTHVPWPLRALSVVVLAAISLALARWIYDAGREFAGYHSQTSEQEVTALREQVLRLTQELDETRKVADSSKSRLQIEVTALEKLSGQIRALEEENTRLKSEVAVFENLAGGNDQGPPGLEISRLTITEEGGKGRYRFRAIVAQKGAGRDRETRAVLQLAVTVARGSETVIMDFPHASDGGAGGYPVHVRRFGRVEGAFEVPLPAKVSRVEARLIESGAVKARQAVAL